MNFLKRNGPELLALVCLVGVTVQACTHEKALIITGESLDALSVTFESTAAAMDKALDDKAITEEQYRKWRAFGLKFQQAFPLAANLWVAAVDTQDEKLQVQAGAAVAQLGGDLAEWAALVGVR